MSQHFMISKNRMFCALVATSLSFCFVLPAVQQAASAAPAAKKNTKTEKPAAKPADADKDGKADKDADKEKAGDKTADKDKAGDKKEPPKPEVVIENVVPVKADELVDKPHDFLGKNVKFNAAFFAFSNLALDYKPAFRSSKTHISFLVSKAKKQIPISELKLAMMIPKEKDPDTTLLANLKEGDSVEITGKVFSSALDDPWVEVLKIKKLGGDDKKVDVTAKAKTGESKGSSDKINDTKSGDSKSDKNNDGKPDGDSKAPAKN
jgi:hypothetical protein